MDLEGEPPGELCAREWLGRSLALQFLSQESKPIHSIVAE